LGSEKLEVFGQHFNISWKRSGLADFNHYLNHDFLSKIIFKYVVVCIFQPSFFTSDYQHKHNVLFDTVPIIVYSMIIYLYKKAVFF